MGCYWQVSDGDGQRLLCRGADGVETDASFTKLDTATWRAAVAGEPVALSVVGRFYLYGSAAVRDGARAKEALEASAAKGNVRAMNVLGDMYRDGIGTPKDYVLAARWYRAAADIGDAQSLRKLGGAYINAAGVPQDYNEAMRLCRAAADKGDAGGMECLVGLYYRGLGVPADIPESIRWARKAAEAGSGAGMSDLVTAYSQGIGGPRDMAEAERWRKTRAEQAQHTLPAPEILDNAFPIRAAIDNVAGRAVFRCRVSAQRSLEDCRVVDEAPGGYGFGEAGLQLMPWMQMSSLLPVGDDISMPITFKLPTGIIANAEKADSCAAESLAAGKVRTLSPGAKWWSAYWLALAHHYAVQGGRPDAADRLNDATEAAVERLSKGQDGGLFGQLRRCSLN